MITVLMLVAIAVVGGASLWWLFVASFGDRQIGDAITEAEQAGWQVSYAESERGGFPDTMEWTIRDVRLTREWPYGRLEARFDVLTVWARPWSPQTLSVRVPDPHQWRWLNADGTRVQEYRVEEALYWIGPRPDAPGWRVTGDWLNVSWASDTLTGGMTVAESLGAVLDFPLSRERADFSLRADRVRLPQKLPFGSLMEHASASGSIAPIPSGLTQADLAAWQERDGILVLEAFETRAGWLEAAASGRMALDPSLRPLGQISLTVADPHRLLRIAQERNWLPGEMAAATRSVLGMVTVQGEAGNPQFQATLQMQDGALWLGPLKLAPLLPLGDLP
ncbi:MAG TPA: DUF2125 domain-containing protein [Alphaproteobacteria bacterium]|nr:DUF2125 domain-containing protein [Alphaproteobacteria bacterium]